MLREHKRVVDGVHVAATGLLMASAYGALYPVLSDREPRLAPFGAYVPTIALLCAFVMAALWQRRARAEASDSGLETAKDLSLAFGFAIFCYGFLAYTLRLPHLSRLYVYGGLALGGALAALWWAAARAWRRGGREARRVLLVGEPDSLAEAGRMIASRPALGLELAGTVALSGGGLAALERALDSSVVDYALFGGYRKDPALMEEAMLACRRRGVEIWFKTDLMSREIAFSRVDYLEDIPLLVCATAPPPGPALLAKRAIDVALSASLLAALSPVLLAAAVLVRLTGQGPVLFRQRRIGLNGRAFTLLKFRSMRREADEDLELRNEMSGPAFKMKGDPRVTPVGRFLRKYSLDELPQLWNVLMGDMSLVGPRPPLPSEVERYEVWHRRRLSMRPGITGLWQVNGRNSIPDFNDWVRLDLRYLDGWSLWLDLKIIIKTVPAVLQGTGL